MKKYIISLFICLLCFSAARVSAEEIDLSETQATQLEELNLANKEFDHKGNEEELGQVLAAENASRSVDSPEVLDFVASIFGYYPHQVVVPITQGWSYVDGARCHVGNYANFYILTVFEGINTKSQLVIQYNGNILSVNRHPKVKYTPGGVTYTHKYTDSDIVTGNNQVIYTY
ncbi:MAG: hypothetical protein H0V82_04130 [Candidatus Protochlamydia sp.]|nr:hypothetical protein [Candidatus Protochlamydia sp.]